MLEDYNETNRTEKAKRVNDSRVTIMALKTGCHEHVVKTLSKERKKKKKTFKLPTAWPNVAFVSPV